MIDFTNFPIKRKTYAGANGSKLCVVYNDEAYMLKFPALPSINKNMSYANSCISEYLGCHIFDIIGIPVQETILGTYRKDGKEKIVVACKDFTSRGVILQDFASLKNTVIDSVGGGYGTELTSILDTIEEQSAVDTRLLLERFWDMFIVDALIGNWDRHNGNWGFLYNQDTDEVTLAPVFDCGSCLYPQADESIMQLVIDNQQERNIRIFDRPLSGINIGGKKIQYHEFVSSLRNADCSNALKRIVPKIDMLKINTLIDETPYISNLQRSFYKLMISERKEHILDRPYRKLTARERSQLER